jgi:TonB family protein
VDPIYPSDAKRLRVEGVVKLRRQIAADGTAKKAEPLSGPEVLIMPAITAVRQWQYQPAILNGKAIEVQKNTDVEFRLHQ